jgi:hypothetical protein
MRALCWLMGSRGQSHLHSYLHTRAMVSSLKVDGLPPMPPSMSTLPQRMRVTPLQ